MSKSISKSIRTCLVGIWEVAGTNEPGRITECSPTTAASITTEPAPTLLPSNKVQAWITHPGSTTTLSPMVVGFAASRRFLSDEPCTTQLSPILVPFPIVIELESPLSTAPYQMEDPAETRTSPITAALAAKKLS